MKVLPGLQGQGVSIKAFRQTSHTYIQMFESICSTPVYTRLYAAWGVSNFSIGFNGVNGSLTSVDFTFAWNSACSNDSGEDPSNMRLSGVLGWLCAEQYRKQAHRTVWRIVFFWADIPTRAISEPERVVSSLSDCGTCERGDHRGRRIDSKTPFYR